MSGGCGELRLWGNSSALASPASLQPLSDAGYPLPCQPIPPREKTGICSEQQVPCYHFMSNLGLLLSLIKIDHTHTVSNHFEQEDKRKGHG